MMTDQPSRGPAENSTMVATSAVRAKAGIIRTRHHNAPESVATSCPVKNETPPRGGPPAWLVAFLGGLALNLTPCTWPLIPITLGVLGALGAGVRRGRGLLLALSFASGLVLVYAALGTVAALLGKPFGALTQNPWIYLGMTALFVAFGFLTLRGAGFQLPSGVVNSLEGLRGRAVAARADGAKAAPY